MTTLKEQTDSIIEQQGLCPTKMDRHGVYFISCSICCYKLLCSSTKRSYSLTDANSKRLMFAIRVKENNYNISDSLFDILL